MFHLHKLLGSVLGPTGRRRRRLQRPDHTFVSCDEDEVEHQPSVPVVSLLRLIDTFSCFT